MSRPILRLISLTMFIFIRLGGMEKEPDPDKVNALKGASSIQLSLEDPLSRVKVQQLNMDKFLKEAVEQNEEATVKGLIPYVSNKAATESLPYATTPEIFDLLISCSPNIHWREDFALLNHIWENRPVLVQKLIGLGVTVNPPNGIFLYRAAQKGFLPIVQHLLTAGASVTTNNHQALKVAEEWIHPDVVKEFLAQYANLEALLIQAVKNKDSKLAAIIAKYRPHCLHAENCKAIRSAIKQGDERMLTTLNSSTVQLEAFKHLHLRAVARQGVCQEDEIERLLKEGGSIDQALIGASEGGDLFWVQLLTRYRNANVHTENDKPIKKAARNGHRAVVLALYAAGANFYCENKKGQKVVFEQAQKRRWSLPPY